MKARVNIVLLSLTLLLFIFNIFNISNTFAQMEVIEEIFTKAKQPNFAKDKKAHEYVNDHFNFNTMSKLILGSEIKKQPKKEIKWFTDQMENILSKTIYKKSSDFLKKVKYEHEYVEQGKKKAEILTIVKKRGEETEIMTKLTKTKGIWKIVDLSIDDELWSENIGSQVRKKIKKNGWKGLKRTLTKRLKELD